MSLQRLLGKLLFALLLITVCGAGHPIKTQGRDRRTIVASGEVAPSTPAPERHVVYVISVIRGEVQAGQGIESPIMYYDNELGTTLINQINIAEVKLGFSALYTQQELEEAIKDPRYRQSHYDFVNLSWYLQTLTHSFSGHLAIQKYTEPMHVPGHDVLLGTQTGSVPLKKMRFLNLVLKELVKHKKKCHPITRKCQLTGSIIAGLR